MEEEHTVYKEYWKAVQRRDGEMKGGLEEKKNVDKERMEGDKRSSLW